MSATTLAAAEAVNFEYARIQRGLHWLMAALILVAIGLGIWSSYLVVGTPFRKALLDVHKSLGMTVLVLLVLRVACRLVLGEPAYRRPLDALTRIGAHLAHGALYLMMLLMPLTGYMFSAANGNSLPWFGLFSWPRLLPHDKPIARLGQTLHHWGAWAICGLLIVHGLAVIWHAAVKRDEVLSRMLPSGGGSAAKS